MIPTMTKTEQGKNIVKLPLTTAVKRKLTVDTLSNVFRYTMSGRREDWEEINTSLKQGKGLVFVTPHFDRGDFIRVFEGLLTAVPRLRRRKMIVPVAAHQVNSPGLKPLSQIADITFASIVTRDTMEKTDTQSPQHKLGEGNREYATIASGVIKDGGAIVVAPQAGRRPSLERWEGNPIRTTDLFLRRNGATDFTYVILGAERRRWFDKRETNYAKRRGMNLFARYDITIGSVISSNELRERALRNGNTLDEEVRQLMLDVAPEAYIPQADRTQRIRQTQ